MLVHHIIKVVNKGVIKMNRILLISQILVILVFLFISVDFLRQAKIFSLIVFLLLSAMFTVYTVINFKNEKKLANYK